MIGNESLSIGRMEVLNQKMQISQRDLFGSGRGGIGVQVFLRVHWRPCLHRTQGQL